MPLLVPRPLVVPWLTVLLALAAAAPIAAQEGPEHGELRVSPAAPRPGQSMEVAYRPGALLRDAGGLVLRARMRTPHDQEALAGAIGAETRRIAVLARGADGWYRGRYRLANSVVYTLLVVESEDGERVDTRGEQGWEVMAHDDRGVPLPAALDQRGWDLTVRDATGGLRNALERVRLHPDDPQGLWRLSFFEGYVLGRDSAIALARGRRAAYDALARAAEARPRVSGETAEALALVAEVMGDSAARADWAERLLRDDPLHPYAVQARALRTMRSGATAAEKLAALEQLWTEAGPAHDQLLQAGLGASLAAEDVEAARRWTARIERAVPVAKPMLANTFLEMPPLRDEGMRLARARLDELAAARDEDRDLFHTASRQRDAADDEAAALLLALAGAHGAAGERDDALRALAEAAARGWDAGSDRSPPLFPRPRASGQGGESGPPARRGRGRSPATAPGAPARRGPRHWSRRPAEGFRPAAPATRGRCCATHRSRRAGRPAPSPAARAPHARSGPAPRPPTAGRCAAATRR